MSADDRLEPLGRVFNIVDHRKFYVGIADDVGVGFVFFVTLFSALLILEAWFIEVHVFAHYNSLNREKNLK